MRKILRFHRLVMTTTAEADEMRQIQFRIQNMQSSNPNHNYVHRHRNLDETSYDLNLSARIGEPFKNCPAFQSIFRRMISQRSGIPISPEKHPRAKGLCKYFHSVLRLCTSKATGNAGRVDTGHCSSDESSIFAARALVKNFFGTL